MTWTPALSDGLTAARLTITEAFHGGVVVIFLVPQAHRVTSGPLMQIHTHLLMVLFLKTLILLIDGGDLQISEGPLGISGLTVPDADVGSSCTSADGTVLKDSLSWPSLNSWASSAASVVTQVYVV